MKSLRIESSKSTPSVRFYPDSNVFEIKGESYPENAAGFYEPVLHWLSRWFKISDQHHMQLNFELVYYNSSSSKAIMNLFDLLEDAVQTGWPITVMWRFDKENEIIRESGEDFQMDYDGLDIRLVAISE